MSYELPVYQREAAWPPRRAAAYSGEIERGVEIQNDTSDGLAGAITPGEG